MCEREEFYICQMIRGGLLFHQTQVKPSTRDPRSLLNFLSREIRWSWPYSLCGVFHFLRLTDTSSMHLKLLLRPNDVKQTVSAISCYLTTTLFCSFPRFGSLLFTRETIHPQFSISCLYFSTIGEFNNHLSFSTCGFRNEKETRDEFSKKVLPTQENSSGCDRMTVEGDIDKLCKSSIICSGAQVDQSLRHNQNPRSFLVYDSILSAASENGDILSCCKIFKEFVTSDRCVRPTSYLTLAKVFTKTNDFVQLLRFIEEVSALTFPSPTVVNGIIYGLSECKEIDKALHVFNHMKTLKCMPDLITYNTIMNMLGHVGRLDEMLQEFSSMNEYGIVADVISYNILLNSFRKVGRFDMCIVYFKEMREKKIEPDLLTYTALIDCLGRSGNVEESLILFKEMKLKHIRPSIYIYRSLISNLKKTGKVDLAVSFQEEMNSGKAKLTSVKDYKEKRRRF